MKMVILVKKIMIDMDDTILADCYLEVVNEYLNTNYTYDDCKEYWIDNMVPQEKQKEYLNHFYNEIDVYEYGHVRENCIKVIEELTKYYEVFICSAYVDHRAIKNCSKILLYKHKWLLENLPFIKPENYIFTNRKDIIPVDIIIDDKVENLKSGEIKLLISAYHNEEIPENELENLGITRVDTWDDIAEILLKH